jgi:Spy/CpxP family protein refolding chaperone
MKNPAKIWMTIAIFLLGTNMAVIFSYQNHLRKEQKILQHKMAMPDSQLGKYFSEVLDLNEEQVDHFRTFRQTYNRKANGILYKMQDIRNEMLKALDSATPDRDLLNQLSAELGNKHNELKLLTFDYYINMQAVLNPEQQKEMTDIFQAMLTSEGYAVTPEHGEGGRRESERQGQGRNRADGHDEI